MKNWYAPLRFAATFGAPLAAVALLTYGTNHTTVSAAPPPQAAPVLVTNSGAAQAVPTAAQGITTVGGSVEVSNVVGVSNAAQSPLFVRDVDNGARTSYQRNMVLIFNNLDGVQLGGFSVPASKIFVVELITVLSQLPNDQRVKLTMFVNDGPSIVQHFFAPAFTGSDFTNDVLTLSQPVRLYARCNNCEYSIRVNATRFGSNQGSGSVQLSFSGHLIDE